MDINQHIEKIKGKLEDPTVSPQSRRHSVEELNNLKNIKKIIQMMITILVH